MEVDRTESLPSASSHVDPAPPIVGVVKKTRGVPRKQFAQRAHDPPAGRARVPAHLEIKEKPKSSLVNTSSIDVKSQADSTISAPIRRSARGESRSAPIASAARSGVTGSKATVKDEPEQETEASISKVDKSTASRTRAGKRAKAKIQSSDSIRDQDAESPVVEPTELKPTAKRTMRGKAAAKAVEEQPNEVSQNEDGNAGNLAPKSARRAKAPSTQTPDEDVMMEDSELAVPKTGRGTKRTAAVKEELQEEAVGEETKPKRSTRTKR